MLYLRQTSRNKFMKLTNKVFALALIAGAVVAGSVFANVASAQQAPLINLSVTATPATVPPEGALSLIHISLETSDQLL